MTAEQEQANALIARANAALAAEQKETALALYREAIALMPDSIPYASYNLVVADTLRDLGRFTEAAQTYETLLKVIPEHDDAWIGLAECLMMESDYSRAAVAFEQGLRINPERADAWYEAAIDYAKQGDEERARTYLARALALQPDWRTLAQEDELLRRYLPPTTGKSRWEFWKK